MKKILIVIIAILILGVLAIPMAFAEGSAQAAFVATDDTQVKQEVLSDLNYYMDLKSPIAMDKTDKYLAVASKTQVFIKESTNQSGELLSDIIPHEYASCSIINICLIQDTLILLISDIEGTIITYDIKTKTTFVSEEDFAAAKTITTNGTSLLGVFDSKILSYNISENSLVKEKEYSLTTGTSIDSVKKLKFFNGTGYIASNSSVYSLNFTTDDVTDGKYAIEKVVFTSETNVISDFTFINDKLVCSYGTKLNIDNEEKEINKNISKISSDSQTILALSSSDNRVYMFDMQGNLKQDYYGSNGSDINRLNSPSAVYVLKDEIYVADTENNRIISQNIKTKARNEFKTGLNKPEQIAKTASDLYYIANKKVYVANNNLSIVIDGIENAKALAVHKNNLIILSGTTLYEYDGSALAKIKENLNSGFDKIKTPANTNNIYLIATQTGAVEKYNLENVQTPILMSTITAGNNYDIDYVGHLYVQTGNTIARYAQVYDTNGKASFNSTPTQTYQIDSLPNDTIFTFIDCVNGGYYIANQTKHLLSFIAAEKDNNKLGITCINNLEYDHPINTEDTPFKIQAGILKEDTKALASPNNPEADRTVKAGETFLVLAEANGGKYYYVVGDNSGYPEYIEKNKFNTLFEHDTTMKNADMAVLYDNVEVYELPYKNSKKLAASGQEIKLSPKSYVEAVYKVTQNDVWNWYKIQIYTADGEAQTGFVKANYIAKKTPTKAPQSILFMKTKAKKIGEKICIYEEANIDSKVISDDVKDGIDIQIIGEFNPESTFTKVFYNNQVGYILTINLQKNGLTPNQIIAISISCTAIVAFTLIIILFVHKNRKLKKQVNEQEVDMLE